MIVTLRVFVVACSLAGLANVSVCAMEKADGSVSEGSEQQAAFNQADLALRVLAGSMKQSLLALHGMRTAVSIEPFYESIFMPLSEALENFVAVLLLCFDLKSQEPGFDKISGNKNVAMAQLNPISAAVAAATAGLARHWSVRDQALAFLEQLEIESDALVQAVGALQQSEQAAVNQFFAVMPCAILVRLTVDVEANGFDYVLDWSRLSGESRYAPMKLPGRPS